MCNILLDWSVCLNITCKSTSGYLYMDVLTNYLGGDVEADDVLFALYVYDSAVEPVNQ